MKTRIVRSLALAWCLSALPVAAQEQVSMNFRNADINSLIESVATITGRTFVVDPRVSGQITIISDDAMNAEMFYEAFLSAIQVQGYQAVEDGAVVRIVPFAQAFGFMGEGAGNELVTRLIRVNNVDAQGLVPVLKPLLTQASRLQAFAESNFLVVTDIRTNVEEMMAFVEEMDDPSLAALEVLSLENISAGEAVHIVTQLNLQQQGLSVVEDSLNNRLIVSGPTGARTAFRNMLRSLDVPTTRAGGVEVIALDYARAEDLKPIMDSMLQSDMFLLGAGEGGEAAGGASYRVEVDADNNALIVAASPAVISEMRNVISQLDLQRPQVLIEAVIAELSEDQANRLSTELAYAERGSGGYLTNFNNLLSTIIGVGANGDITESEVTVISQAVGGNAGGMVLGGDFDSQSGEGFGLLIQALKTDSSTRVLSTPSLVTLDNRPARISVGENVPFLTGSYTTANNLATNPFQTIERQDVGIDMEVTPQISKGDVVRLQLTVGSSKLQNNASQRGTVDVVTAESSIETNVMVEDGRILVLGGLMESMFDDQQSKVPMLGDIPLLGGLFRSSSRGNGDRVLMMFIRPTILRDGESAAQVSGRRFDHLINRDSAGEGAGMVGERMEEFRNASLLAPAAPLE